MDVFRGTRVDMISKLPKGMCWLEVGVKRGDFSAAILSRAGPKKLILVDAWRHQPPEVYRDSANVGDAEQERIFKFVHRRFKKQIETKRVEIRRGYASEIMPTLRDKGIECVYIDANHSRDCVLHDLRRSYEIVPSNGFILGHDYAARFGVVEAVQQFLKETSGLKLHFITNDNCPSFLITEEDKQLGRPLREMILRG